MISSLIQTIKTVDSHTGGEPTRTVIAGGPDLGKGSIAEQRIRLATDHDWFRSALVNEPRGSDAMVGALLCDTSDTSCDLGVIFFNNVGMLNMCVHGTIGVAVTLVHLGRLKPGQDLRLETAVGNVSARLLEDGRVTVTNVRSYRKMADIPLEVEGFGSVTADLAWGGNWFLLIEDHGLTLHLSNRDQLTQFCCRSLEAAKRQGLTGDDGREIDHVELFSPAPEIAADSRNFVLCPGQAYDRSPCGTGTSAKLACLQASGKLAPGQVWRQASILGTLFEGSYQVDTEEGVIPQITGSAFVNAECHIVIDPNDPFRFGINNRSIS